MEEDKPNDSALWTYKLVTPYIVFGYLTGLAATLVWNWWQLGQLGLGISLTFAFPLAVVLVLLYSRPARCILALSVPSLCSSRGRAFLISLAFVMAAVGPTANIVANLKVMLRSLSCGQELLRQALGQMLDVILEPVNAIQLAVDLLLLEVRRVLKQAMVVLLRIQEHMIAITTIFKVARRRKRNEYNHKRRVQEKHFRCFTWLNNRLSRAIRWCSCFSICQTKERCTICGTILTPSTRHPCDTPGCKGVYCFECFEMSYEKCCLCNRPLEYGDFSDVSEVDDSSEDSDMESFGKKRYRKFCGGQS
ncbi:uncharacterized protein LOC108104706 isoform X2 [Drosophila eugracilis]|uniref:uncharacterized protein LOC108104706 isoform X2 n=1 Tax=Drosophila eugracilis TaxID=29029 RepID=UPI0007E8213D|nr:uncharacterized protein LOC108104706 isoform X2 [Drosophila eugracilis]